jgi:hypothetical protein
MEKLYCQLYCHTSLYIDGELCAMKGSTYEIIQESEYGYEIMNENDEKHTFTKEPDDNGFNFASWFDLVE